jgi:hypothetical protein
MRGCPVIARERFRRRRFASNAIYHANEGFFTIRGGRKQRARVRRMEGRGGEGRGGRDDERWPVNEFNGHCTLSTRCFFFPLSLRYRSGERGTEGGGRDGGSAFESGFEGPLLSGIPTSRHAVVRSSPFEPLAPKRNDDKCAISRAFPRASFRFALGASSSFYVRRKISLSAIDLYWAFVDQSVGSARTAVPMME